MSQATHTPAHDETLAESDKPKNSIIVVATVVTVVFVTAMVVAVQQYFKDYTYELIAEQQLRPANTQLRDLQAEEALKTTHYQWVDKTAGVVRIPVERAVELTLRDWGARPDGFTAPAPVPGAAPAEPAPAPAPAPAPEPAKKTK